MEEVVAAIVEEALGSTPATVERFVTGMCHFVHDVVLEDGRRVVVRVAREDSVDYLRGQLHWVPKLAALGVPVARLLAFSLEHSPPYTIVERFPGTDLGIVYGNLSREQKHAVCESVVDAQLRTARLPMGKWFGFAYASDDGPPQLYPSWGELIDQQVDRSRQRILKAGVAELSYIETVADFMHRFDRYYDTIEPVPFLDDTTTKNVIVHDGALSGLVDTDMVCFGDPLLTVGLTRASLQNGWGETEYTDHWCDLLRLREEQLAVVDAYTVLFYLGFMGEMGQQFNTYIEPDLEQLALLGSLIDDTLARSS